VGGDGYKIYLLNKHYKIGLKKVFLAVFSDRVSGLIILGFIASTLTIFFQQFIPYNYWIFLLILVGFIVFVFFTRKYLLLFKKIISTVLFQSFLVQLFQIICVCFLLLSFGDLANYLAYILLFLISSIVIIIPISVGGLGLRELTFLLGVQYFNIETSIAVNLSFSFYLITLFVSLWGTIYVFKPIFLKKIKKYWMIISMKS